MTELISDLTSGDRGERVGKLQGYLVTLGYDIPKHEVDKQFFGEGTRNALKTLQRKSGIKDTGNVDKRTDPILAREVAAVEEEGGTYTIEGRILFENGVPASGTTLQFWTRTIGTESRKGKAKTTGLSARQEVGKTKTDNRGFYFFSYDPSDPKLPVNNIEVVTKGSDRKEISLSKPKYNLERHEVLNLFAPANLQKLEPECDRLFADIKKAICDSEKLAEAKEDDERRDLTLLHQATGWDARLIALAAIAEKRSTETKIPAKFLYALFRVGLPSDLERLCMLSKETINKALEKAAKAGIAKEDDTDITSGRRRLVRFAKGKRLQTKTPGAVSTIKELFDSAGLDDQGERKTFEELYFSHKGKAAELWQKAEDGGISPPSITRLKVWRKLNQLTHDNARLTSSLLKDIESTDELEKLLDMVLYEPDEWQSRLKTLAGENEQDLAALLPPAPSDATLDQRLVMYSKALAYQLSESFRTEVIGCKVQKGKLGRDLDGNDEARELVGSFLRAAPKLGFRLGTTPVETFLKRHRGELVEIGIDPSRIDSVVPQLKRLHRLYQITPSDSALEALDKLPYSAAAQIAAIDPHDFASRHHEEFSSEREALLVGFKSQQVAMESLSSLIDIERMVNGTGVYGMSGEPSVRNSDIARIVKASNIYPTLESLFGSVDYCECEHCRSVLSPAAYFVDLLLFLDPDDAVWGKSDRKPFQILEGRRPDLPNLALTCENTHTALPYIDVVNEILEYATAHGWLEAEAAHDTGEATTPELLAEPHNIERDAYDLLRNPGQAKYPLGLPFDLWLETVRVFLDHFETPLWQVLEAFRTTDELFSGEDDHPTYDDSRYFLAAVLTEYLELSTAEYEILCRSDPLFWRTLYGNPDSTVDLQCARTLSRRLDVSYKELADIVRTRFVNPELHRMALLWRLRMDPSDALEYLHPTGSAEEQSLSSTAFRNRIESVLAEIECEIDVDDVISQIEAFDTPQEDEPYSSFQCTLMLQDTSAQCRFDQTFLRFADEPDDANYQLAFLKINLFVRLWKRLGWTIDETDHALSVFVPGEIVALTSTDLGEAIQIALVRFAHLKAIDEASNLGRNSRQKLLSLWSDLQTTGPASLYAQLFLTPSMQTIDPVFNDPLGRYLRFYSEDESDFVPFEWDVADDTANEALEDDRPNGQVALKNHLSALEAGLGLTADEISWILADAAGLMPNANPTFAEEGQAVLQGEPLTLANVSLLHRYGVLAQGLGLTIGELITLKSLSGLDPFRPISPSEPAALTDDDPTAQSRRFVEIAQQIKECGFSIEDLDYLLRHEFDAVGKYQDASAPPLALLKALGGEIRRIREEHAVPEDPANLTEDLLRQKLALALPLDVAVTFIAMWLGTVEYEAVATGVEELNALHQETFEDRPYIRVSYNAETQEQRLVVRGVLLAADLSQLEHEVSSELFVQLEAHHTQAKDFFTEHLQRDEMGDGRAYGFLAEGDFDVLFERPLPVAGDLTPEVITANHESNEVTSQAKLTLLAEAFLPYLQASLIRQAISTTLSSELSADPTIIETLLLDIGLLEDPTSAGAPLLSAFEAAGERGVTSICETDSGSACTPPVVQTPDTRLVACPSEEALEEARFEGYLEVPANGIYRFFAGFEHSGGRVELYFDGQPAPLLSTVATEENIEDPASPIVSPMVELKAGIPYRFEVTFGALGGGQAWLLIQGENLPKGPLSRLELYPYAAVERLNRGRILLSKVLQLVDGFALGERELRYLLTHAEDFEDIDLRLLPTIRESDPPIPSPLFDPLLRIADYVSLRGEMAAGEQLIDVFEHARRETGDISTIDSESMNAELYALVAEITRRDEATVKAAAEYLGLQVPAEVPETLPVVAPGFTQVEGIRRLWEILQICQRLGARVIDVDRWATPVPDFETARDIKNTIKARYRPEDWQRIAQPIFDQLRRRKRDALVSYLMHNYTKESGEQGFQSMEELFEHFLIDPGMEPVVQTSRIQLAIASLQTFVQRCLLNLETEVSPADIDREEWLWKKNYRMWEANRKILLFPENWLEPEFRDDKTHLFQQLEGTLLQGDITNESAEAAFLDYLNGLSEIAKLQIVTSYFEQDAHEETAFVIHVIGRTPNTHRYFYRQYSSNDIWTPWEPVTVEMEGDHVAAMVWKQRLYLFWITWVPETEENESPAPPADDSGVGEVPSDELVEEASEYTRRTLKAQLNWSSYSQGKWSDPESGELDEAISVVVPEGGLDTKDVFIHVTKELESDGEETKEGAVRIHLNFGDYDNEWEWESKDPGDISESEIETEGWIGVYVEKLGTEIRWKRLKTANRLLNRNSVPKVIGRSEKPAVPYWYSAAQATLFRQGLIPFELRSDEIDVDVNDADGTRIWNIRLPETSILDSGIDYSLQICAQGTDIGDRNPWYPLSPFFYQDDAHAFFVKPMPAAAMLDSSEEEEISPPSAVARKKVEAVLEEATAEAGVVDVPPRESKVSIGISPEANYTIKYSNDWLTNSEMGLRFGDSVIGYNGSVDPPGPDSERATRGRGRTVVGGAGLDSAILTELRGAVSAGRGRFVTAPRSPRIPH